MKKTSFILFCLVLIICSICTKANTSEVLDKFTQDDIIYFNNLKNCTPTYINDNGTARRIIGIESGACVFKEKISANQSTGDPEISLFCRMPKAELSTMVTDLLKVLKTDGSVSPSAKAKYEQAVQQYCNYSVGQ